jgi:hypothetical protein
VYGDQRQRARRVRGSALGRENVLHSPLLLQKFNSRPRCNSFGALTGAIGNPRPTPSLSSERKATSKQGKARSNLPPSA